MISPKVALVRYFPSSCRLHIMCSPPDISMFYNIVVNLVRYPSSFSVCPCLIIKNDNICSCKVRAGFALVLTPVVIS